MANDDQPEVVYKIENWAVVGLENSPYTPPECQKLYLNGIISGHPKVSDEKPATTSRIVDVKGRIVRTKSGSVYELGRPNEEWLLWLDKNGLKRPSEEEPIRWTTTPT